MTITATTQTVREVAQQVPGAAPVFEKYGIDYCCKGHRPLAEVCVEMGLTVEGLFREIQERHTLDLARAARLDQSQDSLTAVIRRICDTHHVYVRNELPRIEYLLSKVPEKHGPNHPELYKVQDVFTLLASELRVHLMKEEQILFPYITRLEEASLEGKPAPTAMFGTVETPINMMLAEHGSAERFVAEMRSLTNDYTPPEDACDGFRNLYKALEDFEADLHQHIAIENDLLFKRSLALAAQ
jgi:regulator of cell morphogenesis and NO signaling